MPLTFFVPACQNSAPAHMYGVQYGVQQADVHSSILRMYSSMRTSVVRTHTTTVQYTSIFSLNELLSVTTVLYNPHTLTDYSRSLALSLYRSLSLQHTSYRVLHTVSIQSFDPCLHPLVLYCHCQNNSQTSVRPGNCTHQHLPSILYICYRTSGVVHTLVSHSHSHGAPPKVKHSSLNARWFCTVCEGEVDLTTVQIITSSLPANTRTNLPFRVHLLILSVSIFQFFNSGKGFGLDASYHTLISAIPRMLNVKFK